MRINLVTYLRFKSEFVSRQFVLFLFAGSFAALVNFVSRIYLNRFMSYSASIFMAYILGMLTAFVLCKIFIFEAEQTKGARSEFVIFAVVNVCGVFQTLVFSLLFARLIFPAVGWTLYPQSAAHLIGISIPIFTSFIGHKYFSFKKLGIPRIRADQRGLIPDCSKMSNSSK